MIAGVACATGCTGKPPAEASRQKEPPAEGEVIVTPPAMAGFVRAYVSMKSRSEGDKDGFMTVHDDKAQTDLKLKLKPLDNADMLPMGMGIYSTCAPMEDASGAVYDVDFISSKTDRGMSITETSIHKTPTETRYEWAKNEREVFDKKPL